MAAGRLAPLRLLAVSVLCDEELVFTMHGSLYRLLPRLTAYSSLCSSPSMAWSPAGGARARAKTGSRASRSISHCSPYRCARA